MFGLCAKWASKNKLDLVTNELYQVNLVVYVKRLRDIDAQTAGWLAGKIDGIAKSIAYKWCKERSNNWREWLRGVAKGHGRIAYKFLKATKVLRLDPAKDGKPLSAPPNK